VAGCVQPPPEYVPKPEELMPSGSEERPVPREFLEGLHTYTTQNMAWSRAFVWKGTWEELQAHLDSKLLSRGYTVYDSGPLPNIESWGITTQQFARDYVSEFQTLQVNLSNLRALREKGYPFETSADYLLFAGKPETIKDSAP
jgi:hypothetical protein